MTIKNKEMTDKIFMKMLEFDKSDAKRIQHFTKVYQYAHIIGVLEGVDEKTQTNLEIASILHDIGIIPSEKEYGSCNGKLQEKVGPEYAQKLLSELGVQDEIIERVKFLIAHHHTYKNVDALDWQILLEADYLVNAFEDNISKEGIKNAMESFFKTKSGTDICRLMYGID